MGILMKNPIRLVLPLVAVASLVASAHAIADPGDQFNLSPAELPAPNSTPPKDISPDIEGEKAGFLPSAPSAFHGSGPYGKPDGYKVVRVHFENAKPTGAYEDFATGFFTLGRAIDNVTPKPMVFGTPAGLTVARDGSLLVADENAIWRVTYAGH
jgi:hypothetical protein